MRWMITNDGGTLTIRLHVALTAGGIEDVAHRLEAYSSVTVITSSSVTNS